MKCGKGVRFYEVPSNAVVNWKLNNTYHLVGEKTMKNWEN